VSRFALPVIALLLAVSSGSVIPTSDASAQLAGAARPQCHGLDATIVGTARADRIVGTPAADVIVGRGAGDVIRGLSGDDALCGGRGGDYLVGGAGDDVVDGGRNGRTSDGKRYQIPDRVDGGPGDDVLRGGGGTELRIDIVDFARSQRAVRVDLAAGTARGQGHDTLTAINEVVGSRYADELLGSPLSDGIVGGEGADRIDGRRGDDRLFGEDPARAPGDNTDDVISGGPGRDLIYGFAGDDTLSAGAPGQFGTIGNAVHGGAGDDILTGGSGNDSMDGGRGTDQLAGGAGDDGLSGNGGDDVIDGGTGNDDLGVQGADQATGGDGHDTILLAPLADGAEIDGGAGVNEVRFEKSNFTGDIDIDLQTGVVLIGSRASHAAGITDATVLSAGAVSVSATDDANAIRAYTTAGATVAALGGDDHITTGQGDDDIDGGDGSDSATAGRQKTQDVCRNVETATGCEVLL
jgi:Ca2+-binding RTX toxin-like protein